MKISDGRKNVNNLSASSNNDVVVEGSAASSTSNSFVKRAIEIGLWAYLIILPLRLQFGAHSFIGNDSPFHARYASLFFSRIFARTFPTTAYSIWNQSWGDKEFLFHAYLAPFCQSESLILVGAKIAAGLLFAAILCSMVVILRRQNVVGALWWAALLPALSVGWDFRMLMVRSHVASILLLLWILFCFEQRKSRPLYILTFIYTWTYTAPYFAMLMCGLMALGRWGISRLRSGERESQTDVAEDQKPSNFRMTDRWLMLGCTAATLAGLVIHPQTPNQFRNDWMHLSLVATRAWGVTASPVELGSEFQSETLREAYTLHPGVLICLAIAWLLAMMVPGVRSRRAQLLLWMTVPAVLLYGLSGRFIEYLLPLTVWALALIWTDTRSEVLRCLASFTRQGRVLLGAGGLILVAGLHIFTLLMIERNIWHPKHDLTQEQTGKWLAANARPGDLIVPLDWTQFPQLYYYAPLQRYVVGLEPTTMEVVYPEKLHYLEDVRLGRKDLDMNELKKMFPDARFVVLWEASGLAVDRLSHKNYVPVHVDNETLVFDVNNYLPHKAK